MKFQEFTLERIQSLYENTVEHNLSDSGVHPYTLRELLNPEQLSSLLDVELGYGWTNGGTELRQSVANLYKNRTPDDVIITNGSAEANFLLVMSVLNPGDDLIVFVPNYLQMWGWAKALGVNVVEVQLREELGWLPDMDELHAAITPRTKMITICHPNNPTGSLLDEAAMTELVDIARAHDLYLHADEVYRGSELDGHETATFADLYDKAIVTAGLSKALALPGLRIGWLVGPADVIYTCWQAKDYTSITTSAISEYVANIVIQPEKRAEVLNRSRTLLNANVDLLSGWLKENNQYSCHLPKAGGMAFMRYAMPINSTKLIHEIREKRSIMLLPGDVYGLDGYIRIGIGAPIEHLRVGLKELSDYTKNNFA
ncbi:aminotransferase class I/II-fold pyridoxal phosphate-dependent enzyme [Kiloniella antarctica]|uniref:Aminotransferase n=1 Tax=Kiloniella antarctica TaxID=1550907 RepID=A0ABW5BLM7_9PROT